MNHLVQQKEIAQRDLRNSAKGEISTSGSDQNLLKFFKSQYIEDPLWAVDGIIDSTISGVLTVNRKPSYQDSLMRRLEVLEAAMVKL